MLWLNPQRISDETLFAGGGCYGEVDSGLEPVAGMGTTNVVRSRSGLIIEGASINWTLRQRQARAASLLKAHLFMHFRPGCRIPL